MKLELTRRNLKRISEYEEPAIEDVLNFIFDFCQDIKNDTGKSADKLSCREEDAMYKRLPWMGRFVMKVMKDKETLLSDADRREHLRELVSKVTEVTEQSEAVEKNIEELAREKDLQLEAEERLVQMKQGELSAQNEIEIIKDRIRELEELDLSDLEKEKEEYSAEYEKKMAELEAVRTACAMSLKELESANIELNDEKQQIEDLEEEKQNIKEEKARLEEQKAALESETAEVKDSRDALDAECEKLRIQLNDRTDLLEETKQKLASLESEEESAAEQLKIHEIEAKQQEIREIKERIAMIESIRNEILHDWYSDWGWERRAAAGVNRTADDILNQNLAIVSNRLNKYSDDLRRITSILSSQEHIYS